MSGQFTGLEIAVVGMAGRFPGAADCDQLWRNLEAGVESISFFSAQELRTAGVSEESLRDPQYVPAKGVLDGVATFDAAFFGYSPREARVTDPQHRLFLECAWHALEDAGYDPGRFPGLVGVYAGSGMNHYLADLWANRHQLRDLDGYQVMIGNDKDHLATRASYKLDLEGPSVVVQTACSTSLVAVHLAAQGLLNGECDMALAGGVTATLPEKAGYRYQEGMIHSPDGHCRAFAARGRGTVGGNGVGVVVLRRLEDALAAGDAIRAVIKGSAINNDGAQKIGYTAPRIEGQARVIRAAQLMAEVEAGSISYVEAHGTGTPLGDPIEVAALTRTFRATTDKTGFCALGSVKTNVGHLDTAAGVAGLIKTVLALEHRRIPPSLHCEEPNPEIDFAASPFYVNTACRDWPAAPGAPRRAAVSSFGIGGTNAHAILEEAPPRERSESSRCEHLVLLSARTPTALETMTDNLAAHLGHHPELDPADVAFTSQVGRRAFPWRRGVVASDLATAAAALSRRDSERVFTREAAEQGGSVAFLFPGQGEQYPGMGAEIYRCEPTFRHQLDACCEILAPLLDRDPLATLFGEGETIDRTSLAQPLLFAVEYALARLWMGWGVEPAAMIGHSVGEYVAACLAGVMSPEDALGLLVLRGRLMEELPGGGMLGLPLPSAEARELAGSDLDLAAVNAPDRSVVAGPEPALGRLEEELRRRGIRWRRLRTSRAFHSRMMEPAVAPFADAVARLTLRPPERPYLANLTGTWIRPEEATDPGYWAAHLRSEVRFSDGLGELLREPRRALLELGPGQTLTVLARRRKGPLIPPRSPLMTRGDAPTHPRGPSVILPVLGRRPGADGEAAALYGALGRAWGAGVEVDWTAFSAHERRHRVALPAYPFERRLYRIEAEPPAPAAEAARDEAETFHVPVWRQAPPPLAREPAAGEHWLIFADDCGLGARIAEELGRRGARVTTAADPATDGDALLDQLEELPPRWIHCRSVTAEDGEAAAEDLEPTLDRGFRSLVGLAQALGRRRLAEPLRLVVVSNNLHRIAGERAAAPEKATLLGPCQVIPREYPGITCQSVDVCLPAPGSWEERFLAEAIVAEATAEPPEALVAYRGGCRWLRSFEPLPLAAGEPRSRLRDDGAYLITGGLGAMGLAFAERFVREAGVRLALVSQSGLPPRAEWSAWLAAEDPAVAALPGLVAATAAGDPAAIARLEGELGAEIEVRDLGEVAERLAALCASWAFSYLAGGGLGPPGSRIGRGRLREALGVLPKFHRFYDYMLALLAAREALRLAGDEIEVLAGAAALGDPEETTRTLVREHPEFEGLLSLLAHCTASYGEALRGDVEAIGVLFPDGDQGLVEHSAARTVRHGRKELCCALAAELVARRVEASPSSRLKVLEVGAGNGILTATVIGRLRSRNLEYHFTDLGRAFVLRAEERAGREGIDFMRFATLDVSRDPRSQGFTEDGFDLVLALDVVHATRNVAETLAHLRGLLAPGGALVLLEVVRPDPWLHLIWGLAEGWWYFDDGRRRDHPLLPVAGWQQALEDAGFAAVASHPAAGEDGDYALLTARAAGGPPPGMAADVRRRWRTAERIRRLRRLEALGAEVAVLRADVADYGELEAAVDAARRRFGPLRGVIHAAGRLGAGVIQLKEPRAADEVLAPKVRGTLHLDRLLAEEPLDFFVLCSSTSALGGASGQVDYCAANAFLDAFAHWRSSYRGQPATSVNWDRWRQVGMAVDAEDAAAESDRRPEHSLLGRCVYRTSDPPSIPPYDKGGRPHPSQRGPERVVFASRLGVEGTWALDEHRLLGWPILPGTAYLEMVRAAWEELTRSDAVELRDVVFRAPLVVAPEEEAEVFTVLDRRAEGFDFQVLSAVAGAEGRRFRSHASGAAGALTAAAPARDELARRIEELASAPQVEARPGRSGGFGRRWQSLRRHQAVGPSSLVTLELAPELSADLERFKLHPALLDVATGVAFTAADLEGFYVPLSYRRLRLWAPLVGELRVVARRHGAAREVSSVDVAIADREGRVLAEVEGFTRRRLDPAGGEAALAAAGGPSAGAQELLGEDAFPEIPARWWERPAAGRERGLRPQEGVEALWRILFRERLPQVVVTARGAGAMAAGPAVAEAPKAVAPPERPAAASFAERGEPEATLSRLWCEVLGVGEVALSDNFFELGGDSILGLQVVARAREAGLELTPEQVFEHQTIAGLAAALRSAAAGRVPEAAAPAPSQPEPSDFPLANLDQRQLGKLMRKLEEIDDDATADEQR